jgi:hypothetical protein
MVFDQQALLIVSVVASFLAMTNYEKRKNKNEKKSIRNCLFQLRISFNCSGKWS